MKTLMTWLLAVALLAGATTGNAQWGSSRPISKACLDAIIDHEFDNVTMAVACATVETGIGILACAAAVAKWTYGLYKMGRDCDPEPPEPPAPPKIVDDMIWWDDYDGFDDYTSDFTSWQSGLYYDPIMDGSGGVISQP